ncbi:MAG: class I SAM-dependent methyltransferase [Rhodoferax sp.]|nr:class I SAM-dependent methyltransferase [Rhodoferax sp.]
MPHGLEPVSEWVRRWTHLVKPGGSLLDLACGRGRHLRWFAALGHPVTGVDQSTDALQAVGDLAAAGHAVLVQADIEEGTWPLLGADGPLTYDAVVVTNYLWRPLLPTILRSVAPSGILLYETFAIDQATVGRPSRPDFLLRPGELLQQCASMRIVAFEDGFCSGPDRFVQRIAAVQAAAPTESNDSGVGIAPRYQLAQAMGQPPAQTGLGLAATG